MNAIRFVNYSRFNSMLKNLIKTISIILFLASCSSQDEVVVAIQPFKGFPTELTDSVENAIQRFYGFQTIRLDPIEIPENYFVNIKSPRYRADSLICFDFTSIRIFFSRGMDLMHQITEFDCPGEKVV